MQFNERAYTGAVVAIQKSFGSLRGLGLGLAPIHILVSRLQVFSRQRVKSSAHFRRSANYVRRIPIPVSASHLLFALGALVVCGNAAANVVFVQGTSHVGTTAPTATTVTYTGPQSPGDLNVVAVGWCDGTNSVQSVSDTSGNTYTLAVGPTVLAGTATQSIYYTINATGTAANGNSVTVTFSGAACTPDVRIAEYYGIDPTNPVDTTAGASGDGTAMSSGFATTTNAQDLLVGANYIGASTTGPGSGYTQRMFTAYDDILEDDLVSATGSYDASATQNGASWWVMQLVAFRAASGGGDTQPPTAPTGLNAVAASSSEIDLSWTASTDNVWVTGYALERCQGVNCSTFSKIAAPTSTTYNDATVVPGSSYSYRIRATDAAGNLSGYSTASSATTSPSTNAPTGFNAVAVSSSEVDLSWTASTGSSSVSGYLLERCQGVNCSTFAQIAAPTSTSYNDTNLTAETSYSYRIRATDAAGNPSGYSAVSSATTLTPLTTPTGLTASAASSSEVDLVWLPSIGNLGVSGYLVERCPGASCSNFTQVGQSESALYIDTGLTASTSYSYRVRATDASGDLSAYGGPVSAMTQGPDTVPPNAPTVLTATSVSNSEIDLSWIPSTDNVALAGYLLERCEGLGCTNFQQVTSLSSAAYADAGLAAGTSFSYRVRAADLAGNLSTYSNVASATPGAGGICD